MLASSCRRSLSVVVVIAALLLSIPPETQAQANLRGRWTSKGSSGACWGSVNGYGFCEGSEPVHMVLTRNAIGGHHSQLLWYEGHQHSGGTWEGGLWGWDPATTTASKDCSTYPQASFSSLSFSNPGYNIFCSGHSVLADGRVLLSGGTVGGEGGDKRSILFNPASNTWALQDTMELWRWYPTNTALPDGKVLVSSGSMYVDMMQFGGRTSPGGTTLHGDSIEKLALVPGGFWEVPAAKLQGYPTSGWPASRDGHSSVWMNYFGTWVIFGGRDGSGTSLLDNTWSMYRNLDNDHFETYSGVNLVNAPTATRPQPRYRHAAAVPGMDAGTMLVFGGRVANGSGSSSITNNVWNLYRDSLSLWHWEEVTSSIDGTPPSARQGHTAIWDPEHRNVLIFGGADAAENPIDSRLYKIHVPLTGAMSWDTVFVEPDPLTGRSPAARHGHAFVHEEVEYTLSQGAPDSDYEYRAILWGGKGAAGVCSPDTVWILWIPEEGSGKNYRWKHVVVPGTKPSGRYRFGADIEKGTSFVVTGGDDGSAASAETWRLRLGALAVADSAQWTRQADNPKGPSTGHTLTVGHSKWARKQEVFDPTTGDWSPLGTLKRQDWYPFHFLLPQSDSTRIFYAGPNDSTFLLNLTASPNFWRHFPATMPTELPYPRFRSGSAVMYLPGKFMRTGSRDTDGQGTYTRGTTMTLDLTALPGTTAWTDSVHWVVRDSMESRVNFNLVLLPDGTVFSTGGTGWINNTSNALPRYFPQLWNPGTMTWTPATGADTLAMEDAVRGYHSNAVLLPDGRVLAIGGNGTYATDPAANDARRATVYCPPYLFKSTGALRPRLGVVPTTNVDYGTEFTVCTDDPSGSHAPSSLVLIRPASSTHGWNMEQRYLPLTFQSACGGRQLTVNAPANSHIAPPGDYLIFANAGSGYAPSIGQWIRLGPTESPLPPECICEEGFGATIAGGDGSSWNEENALATSDSDATPLRLTSAPIGQGGAYTLKLSQGAKSTTTVDQLEMWSVDHAASKEAFASETRNYVGTRTKATAATSSTSGDVTTQANGLFGMSQQVEPGDTLVIELGSRALAPFVAHARRASRDVPDPELDPLVRVETEMAPDVWREVARFEPRLEFADATIDSCTGRVRLFSAIPFQIQGLGQVQVDEESAIISASPSSAVSGTGLNLSKATSVVSADGLKSTLAKDETLVASWEAIPPVQGKVRTYFVRSKSRTIAEKASGLLAGPAAGSVEPAFVFALGAARPNPSRGRMTIAYSLASAARVTIRVYDAAGRLVRTLIDRNAKAGPDEIVWDGTNDQGRRIGSGVFFYRMDAGEWRSQKKLVVLSGGEK